jgi:hypothetical protein
VNLRKRSFLVAGLLACTGAVPASAATGQDKNSSTAEAASAPTGDRPLTTRAGANPAGLQGTWVYRYIDPGVTSCPAFRFCIWNGLGYTGTGVAIGGTWSACEAFTWEGSPWENKVYSVKNNASGGLNYDWLYDLVPTAYSGDFLHRFPDHLWSDDR